MIPCLSKTAHFHILPRFPFFTLFKIFKARKNSPITFYFQDTWMDFFLLTCAWAVVNARAARCSKFHLQKTVQFFFLKSKKHSPIQLIVKLLKHTFPWLPVPKFFTGYIYLELALSWTWLYKSCLHTENPIGALSIGFEQPEEVFYLTHLLLESIESSKNTGQTFFLQSGLTVAKLHLSK